jgi:hypothetical protein
MRSIRLSVVAIAMTVAIATSSRGQSAVTPPGADTSFALSEDMRLLDRAMLGRARATLERGGNTFLSYAMFVPDTVGEFTVMEIGEEVFIDTRQPSVHRDSLRVAARKHQSYDSKARTIGIITDSIAGPVTEAVDGSEGPDFPRIAITELENRAGACLHLERVYRFAKEPKGDWGFGTVVFDPPRVTSCTPFGYWPPDSATTADIPASRPHLARPIVRALEISSLGNYFSVVGRFRGTLTVFDDSIVVRFDTLLARRQFPADPQQIRLDSIRVGVGVGDERTWSPLDDSKGLRIARTLTGDTPLIRRNVRFVMRHERRESDADSWIVVTFHITVGRKGAPHYQPRATTYAHSRKGVLAEDR